MEDSTLYGEIIRNPFLYASALAGFSIESNDELEKSKEICGELIVEEPFGVDYSPQSYRLDEEIQ
ncbi:hypothetical protein E2636_16095 [Paenisporosarcina antarctica]|uniref:Uncharacterized protein n=1 Tax=Paenisporosarcina antarctica TaxID=417367 RepID=A0A4P7A3I0_9BACL|nr:hypothetical protein [Paenisporosarcina antarctica]QBP42576.1 hypothetical protein E2636_16095 [Paenisporosarcina antarctica]